MYFSQLKRSKYWPPLTLDAMQCEAGEGRAEAQCICSNGKIYFIKLRKCICQSIDHPFPWSNARLVRVVQRQGIDIFEYAIDVIIIDTDISDVSTTPNF